MNEDSLPRCVFLFMSHPAMRASAASFFSREGIPVLEASNFEDAIRAFKRAGAPSGLVISDLVLEGAKNPHDLCDTIGNRSDVEVRFLYDPWQYIPPRFRTAFPIERLIEAPLNHLRLAESIGGKVEWLKERPALRQLAAA